VLARELEDVLEAARARERELVAAAEKRERERASRPALPELPPVERERIEAVAAALAHDDRLLAAVEQLTDLNAERQKLVADLVSVLATEDSA
jgi:hypothetical protein